jgi:regulator of sigma E protease
MSFSAHFLFYAAAFAVALGVLIVVHELGHYACARLFGVKVLRFSIGFGKPLLLRRLGKDGTEWALSTFPLGGYVRMLDENEAPVPAEELHRAFNRQPVGKRIMIVAAGPLANLVLAVFLYWALFLHGVQELRPILAAPAIGTAAAQAGIGSGDTVRAVSGTAVTTWQELRWEVLNRALQNQELDLELIDRQGNIGVRRLATSAANLRDLDADLLQQLGLELYRPRLKPVIAAVTAGMPAAEAGMRPGDEIISVSGKRIEFASDVTAAVTGAIDRALTFEVRRDGAESTVTVTPRAAKESEKPVGRIGITFKDDPSTHIDMLVLVRYAALPGFAKAVQQTWQTSVLYLKLVGRMISGQLSWRNLSGPVTIADYAGQSASAGLGPYLNFLALISISLGVLNLLPIPILDGGHLLYYLAEIIRGGPLPDRVAEIGRQIGFALLVLLMVFALYNDINRLLPG